MNHRILFVCRAAVIAALYVVLTLLCAAVGLSSGVIQLRLSEALCVLPAFCSAAVPGLYIGCLLANLITGCMIQDVIIGSFATLLGAVGTYLIGRWEKGKLLLSVPPIVANTLLVPPVLVWVYGVEDAYWFVTLTVCAGEVLSCGVVGMILYRVLLPHRKRLFS